HSLVTISPLLRRALSLVFSQGPVDHRVLPSFPTRRSSDLDNIRYMEEGKYAFVIMVKGRKALVSSLVEENLGTFETDRDCSKVRSEEHTSELQSRFDLVCRLLLEKKKS